MIALANLPAALRKASACAALALAACAPPPEPDVGAAAGGLYRVGPARASVSMWIGHLGLSRYPGRFAYNGSAPNPFNRRETLGVSATGAIDRTAFGMTALPGFVGATIDLVIEIEFIAAG